ncbi:UNKNOWN [Stylonychia lemnae]|uniref:Uncharacterized protein n=1 Tax=Stylonychia lemnae TaxID=5949 RepID=A0A078BBC0_STYLE|nr:UNKNOWN [Stylonychia lemnae]|eukprot:CDW90863.1 UNKNOWN [Stylonychia lemnae]
MIVSTDYVYESGKGTAMFSKNGRLTSFQHKVFTDPVEGYKKSTRKEEEISIPDELVGKNEYLPMILQQANKQNYLERLKTQNKVIQQQQTLMNGTDRGEMNKSELNQENQEENELGSRNKRSNYSPVGGSYSFKAISRNRSVIADRYYGTTDNPDPAHYRPNNQPLERKEMTLKFKYSEEHKARQKLERIPECVQANMACTLDIRKAVRLGQKGTITLKPIQEDEMQMTREEVQNQKKGYYSNQMGKLNIPFDKVKDRTPNVMLCNPIPHDMRFEVPKYDLGILSQNQKTDYPTLDKVSPRGELFKPKERLLQYDVNLDMTQQNSKKGVLEFQKITKRKPNDNSKPYQTPDGYDHQSLERAYQQTSDYKRPLGVVPIDKTYPRDDSMYKYSEEALKIMKKKNLKKDFSFISYLPHSVMKSDHTSRNSLASTAHSLLQMRSQTRTRRDSNNGGTRNNSDLRQLNLSNIERLDGSFLCMDEKKKRIVDLSRINITSREFITGERSNTSFLKDNKFL